MNYQKIYDQLIAKRQKNQLIKCGDYSIETHHIIPKSWGGTDDLANKVNLSLREHFLAHKLLIEIAIERNNVSHMKKMISAILQMYAMNRNDPRRNAPFHMTSRVYEKYRMNYDNGWLGREHKMTTRAKIRATMTPKDSSNPRIWVCRNGIVKYVLKTQLQEFLDLGFEFGRKSYKPRKGKFGSKI